MFPKWRPLKKRCGLPGCWRLLIRLPPVPSLAAQVPDLAFVAAHASDVLMQRLGLKGQDFFCDVGGKYAMLLVNYFCHRLVAGEKNPR